MSTKKQSNFSDARLDKVFVSLLENMVSRWTLILRKLGNSFAQATQFSRFINNGRVTPKAILCEYWQNSSLSFSGKHLLIVSDTTTLTFINNAKREDLGLIDDQTDKAGFSVHPAIVLDRQTKSCYGLGGISVYQKERLKDDGAKVARSIRQANRNKAPFIDKERYKWFAACAQAISNCLGAASYTLVGDREADIYALISMTLERNWHFIYRSKSNRKLLVNHNNQYDKLRDKIESMPIECTYELDLVKTKKRSAHRAKLHVKYGEVTITRSTATSNRIYPPSTTLRFVEVREDALTVVGKEKPVHWIILTSHEVNNVADALHIINCYKDRWTIEEVFRTIKIKGLNIESTRYEKFHGLQNLTTIALIAATQVMQLRKAWEGSTQQPIGSILLKEEQLLVKKLNAQLEGKTEKLKNPHANDSAAYASWVIARLGGWSGYHSSDKPGPITFMTGLSIFCSMMRGYYLVKDDG